MANLNEIAEWRLAEIFLREFEALNRPNISRGFYRIFSSTDFASVAYHEIALRVYRHCFPENEIIHSNRRATRNHLT